MGGSPSRVRGPHRRASWESPGIKARESLAVSWSASTHLRALYVGLVHRAPAVAGGQGRAAGRCCVYTSAGMFLLILSTSRRVRAARLIAKMAPRRLQAGGGITRCQIRISAFNLDGTAIY
ncbi:hypothetical protein [Nonomuraea dietziae]|uniref:hypothetical protein n=1 Tax=Nonomuraea dietziae TaxID=65515 RepID=UPI0031E2C122